MLTRRAAVSILAGYLTLAASSLPVAAQNADKLKVVATFSILGESQVLIFNSQAHAQSTRFHVLSSGQRFCMHRQLVLS